MDVDPLLKVRNWGTSVWEQLYLFWIQNTLLKPKQQKWHDLQNFFSDFSSLIVLTWWGCGTPGAADTYWQAKQSDFGSCGSNNSHVQVVEARPWRMTLKGKAVFSQHVGSWSSLANLKCNTAGCWKVEDLLNQMWKIFDKLYVKIWNITTPS